MQILLAFIVVVRSSARSPPLPAPPGLKGTPQPSAARRDRHRCRAHRGDRPGARPRPSVEDAGHHRHQLDPRTRCADPLASTAFPSPFWPDRAADLPLRALLVLQDACGPVPEGLRRLGARPRVRHPRDLRRLDLLLFFSRSRWCSSRCIPHRPLGRRRADPGGLEVHPFTLFGSVVMLLGLLLNGLKRARSTMTTTAGHSPHPSGHRRSGDRDRAAARRRCGRCTAGCRTPTPRRRPWLVLLAGAC